MGNHRFRLSDMIPNAWFYKLKDMGRTRNQNINHSRKKTQPVTSLSSTTTTTSSSTSSSLPTTTAANPPHLQSKTSQPHHHHHHHLVSHQRKSYYYTRDLTPPPQSPIDNPKSPDATIFPDLPRKSSKQNRPRNRASSNVRPSPKLVTSSGSAACSCDGATLESVSTKPDSTSEEYPNSPLDSTSDPESLFPEFGSDLDHDIVINISDKSLNAKFDGFDSISKLELAPIVTKKPINDSIHDIEKKKIDCNETTKQRTGPVRRLSASSPGLRLRTNSPRIASKKIQAHARKSVSSSSSTRRSLSESFAVVKSSADPQRDFRESMVEMILQNNMRASKDLEDLLTCYLQLNSDEYHEIIIKVFKQIWFDLADVRLK